MITQQKSKINNNRSTETGVFDLRFDLLHLRRKQNHKIRTRKRQGHTNPSNGNGLLEL